MNSATLIKKKKKFEFDTTAKSCVTVFTKDSAMKAIPEWEPRGAVMQSFDI